MNEAATLDGGEQQVSSLTIGFVWIFPRSSIHHDQLRIAFATDDNDDGKNDFIGYYSGDDSKAANRPQLVVVYR